MIISTVKRVYRSVHLRTANMMAQTNYSSTSKQFANRLVHEKSPYLLQHAHNPVNWYPWEEEAFERAKKEDKPIFLSVGYSTCHWCHVMERESFENEEIAKIMNEHFINIKVDREERPDVDRVYMTFVQATTGSGGWPMSVWLTPELKPFLGGTYFPPKDSFARPGFVSVLLNIAEKWKKDRQKLIHSGNQVIELLQTYVEIKSPEKQIQPSISMANKALYYYINSFDAKRGGFGDAPKFPSPVILHFLHTYYALQRLSLANASLEDHSLEDLKMVAIKYSIKLDDDASKDSLVKVIGQYMDNQNYLPTKALEMSLATLKAMGCGGIHDHVGKGFHRYSTDENWHVPHFEKMLYDQAQLTTAYLAAYQITKDDYYAIIARDILEYVGRDLSHTEGGFYSAEDADSYPSHGDEEKKEGAFCVWTAREIRGILGQKDSEIFAYHYNVKEQGNVDESKDPHGELQGKNVLIESHDLQETADNFRMSVDELKIILQRCLKHLYQERQKRPRPHLDDKIITSWNGLMISAFAQAYQVLGDEIYLKAASNAALFLHSSMYDADRKILRRCYRKGPSKTEGFLDDYAFMIQALIDLYEASFDEKWLTWAMDLQSTQDKLFFDESHGGYFNVPADAQHVLLRMKEDHDAAEPSANSVAVINLLRLSHIFNHQNYLENADRTLITFQDRLNRAPQVMPFMMVAVLLRLHSIKQILVTHDLSNKLTQQFIRLIRQDYIPNRVLLFKSSAGMDSVLSRHNSLLPLIPETSPAVYICEHFTCSSAITDPKDLAIRLLTSSPIPSLKKD